MTNDDINDDRKMPKMPFDNEQHNSSYSNNTKQQNIDDKNFSHG